MRVFARRLLALGVLVAVGWFGWLYYQIHRVAEQDEVRPSDAIAVFGAAEYAGRPSPVLHARLDHAIDLFHEQVAPLIVTLGGGGIADSGHTEGGVGRDYLLQRGIPYDHIIVETESTNTEQQVRNLAFIAHQHHLNTMVVVSDGTHLFRIRKLCENAGLVVYTSPRPPLGHIDNVDLTMRYLHEMLSYTAMRMHLNLDWMRE